MHGRSLLGKWWLGICGGHWLATWVFLCFFAKAKYINSWVNYEIDANLESFGRNDGKFKDCIWKASELNTSVVFKKENSTALQSFCHKQLKSCPTLLQIHNNDLNILFYSLEYNYLARFSNGTNILIQHSWWIIQFVASAVTTLHKTLEVFLVQRKKRKT